MAAAGAQVLKGEKATTIVFYKDFYPGRVGAGEAGDAAAGGGSPDDGDRPRSVARGSPVFFVELFGDDPPAETEIINRGEAYLAGSGARFL